MSSAWHHFVPAGVRASMADIDGAAPLVSGQLLARHAGALAAPVVELTATRAAVLIGFLRACRQAHALAVIAVPAAIRRRAPDAGERALRGVLAAAAAAHHDLPIVVVARADRGADPERDDLAGLGRDIVAGYSALGVDAAACADTAVLLRLMHVADELDLGIELEIAAGDDLALLLAEIDDRALPVSAIRGAAPLDETGRASRVVDIADVPRLRGLDPGGLRVNIDAITAAINGSDDEVEARAWLQVSRTLRALQAGGTASRLAGALDIGSGP